MESEHSTFCRRDYESFTDSWFAADKNPGGRTPHSWASCADHRKWDVPRDDRYPRMPPVNRARRRALRAMLSALAGGGLTAAGLGGPLDRRGAGRDRQRRPAPRSGQRRSGNGETATSSDAPRTTTTPATTSTPSETTTGGEHHDRTATPGEHAPTSTPQTSASAAPAAEARRWCSSASRRRPPALPRTRARRPPRRTAAKRARPTKHSEKATGPNNVASSPQMVAAEAGALAAILASSEASDQALVLLPHPAVPAADLQGRRGPVRRAVADPRGDQRNRDRLRQRPVGLDRRRRRLDAVRAEHLAAVRRRRAERRLRRPVQPGRRDLRRRALSARRRRRDQPARGDPRLQPLRRIRRIGAAAGEADLHAIPRR